MDNMTNAFFEAGGALAKFELSLKPKNQNQVKQA